MSPKLKPLLLPQLVEERRRRESLSDSEMDYTMSSFYYTQSSTTSDVHTPITPTFSGHGHWRYPSSTSSVESPFNNSVIESPTSSPTFVPKPGAGKRSLPDVQEEPQEREEGLKIFDDSDELYDCLCDVHHYPHRDNSMAQSSVQLSMKPEFEYDLADGFFSDGDYSPSPRGNKRRAVESPIADLAARFGTKFPSFSWRLKLKKARSRINIASDAQRDNAALQGASSRSSSVSNSAQQIIDNKYFDHQMPPTPTKSIFDSRENLSSHNVLNIDVEKANNADLGEDLARTPLLPPLLMDASANKQIDMQSPLESPSVAERWGDSTGTSTPIDSITFQLPGLPSPPLSNKPSTSSFHRSGANRSGTLIPSSEIPTMVLGDPDDEWAQKLGHANFEIQPAPYIPENPDLEACRQLRANWELARSEYERHLIRTGEHYGTTSKTYQLTEEKWAVIDATWKQNNDITIAGTVESGDPFATLKQHTLVAALSSGGKFPQLNEGDVIVGPMATEAPKKLFGQLQRNPSRKTKLVKFLVEKFPVGLGKS